MPEDQEVETEVFRASRALLIYYSIKTPGTGAGLLILLWLRNCTVLAKLPEGSMSHVIYRVRVRGINKTD